MWRIMAQIYGYLQKQGNRSKSDQPDADVIEMETLSKLAELPNVNGSNVVDVVELNTYPIRDPTKEGSVLGNQLLVEAEDASLLDSVLKVLLVTPKRDGEGETLLAFGSFWDFIVPSSLLVEIF